MLTGMEVWEFKDNSAPRCAFKVWDDPGRDVSDDFESRYPDDYTKLSRLFTWMASTVNDVDKFKRELDRYWDLDNLLAYYVMSEVMALTDSMAKNLFIANYGNSGNLVLSILRYGYSLWS